MQRGAILYLGPDCIVLSELLHVAKLLARFFSPLDHAIRQADDFGNLDSVVGYVGCTIKDTMGEVEPKRFDRGAVGVWLVDVGLEMKRDDVWIDRQGGREVEKTVVALEKPLAR